MTTIRSRTTLIPRPTALSTKKQVSRTRQIISLPSRQSHDPRFLSTAGRLDPSLHAKGYNFLPELLATEMTQLRQSLAAAVKLEKSCPLREKPQRTAEREEIERDVARLRTKLDRQKIAQREREALAGVNKEERERRKEGKGAWYMKKGAFMFYCSNIQVRTAVKPCAWCRLGIRKPDRIARKEENKPMHLFVCLV